MIHTSLSPNAEADDVLLAAAMALTPWSWKSGEPVRRVEESIEEILGAGHVVTVDSGRTALHTILKAFDLQKDDEVLLQAYTCVAVPEPILWLQCKPVYVDCNKEYTIDIADLEKKITPKSKVIIAQHTFGKAADMDAILAIAKKHNLFVIEDCAHALGGKYKNKPLGSLADAAFFSFGRDKCVSSVFGGAIAVREETLYKKIKSITDAYPLPKNIWVLQQLMHPIVLTLSKSTYNFLSLGKIILEGAKRLNIISKAVEPVELSGGVPSFAFHRFSPALAELAYRQLQKLPRFLANRRELARTYAGRLSGLGGIHASAYDPEHAYLRYTIELTNTSPKEIFDRAKARGIQLGDWYTSVLAPRGVMYEKVQYALGSCPQAEYLANHTLNLPTHIGIKPTMTNDIVACIIDNHV